jgi:hypothetical protein
MRQQISFQRDMQCCKPARCGLGMACTRPYQLCCASLHLQASLAQKGLPALKAFAAHLLGFWPASEVFYVFATGRQMSALAIVCAERWAQIPGADARAEYRADLVGATQVRAFESGRDNAAAFVATFDCLCEAGSQP